MTAAAGSAERRIDGARSSGWPPAGAARKLSTLFGEDDRGETGAILFAWDWFIADVNFLRLTDLSGDP
ncbi:hypothetical protein [Roseiarcus fermentans]|uniref:hypothetical protein n=1 Tax=Roseiarcus fermentans TaxID=1473586 RepID=UPI000DE83409|nr:hypothetical protein [Roseiarcus fermentans]